MKSFKVIIMSVILLSNQVWATHAQIDFTDSQQQTRTFEFQLNDVGGIDFRTTDPDQEPGNWTTVPLDSEAINVTNVIQMRNRAFIVSTQSKNGELQKYLGELTINGQQDTSYLPLLFMFSASFTLIGGISSFESGEIWRGAISTMDYIRSVALGTVGIVLLSSRDS